MATNKPVTVTVTNQKPVDLTPILSTSPKGDVDIPKIFKELLIDPLYTPLKSGIDVEINIDGQNVDADLLCGTMLATHDDIRDDKAEETMKAVYHDTLVSYDGSNKLPITWLFSLQSATRANMALPSANIVYTPAVDVIPTSKKFLAGTVDYDTWFSSLAFYAKPRTVGYYFANERCFDDFKAYFKTLTTPLSTILDADTNLMLVEFDKIKLDGLTESLLLRKKPEDAQDEYSFARLLQYGLNEYIKSGVSDAEMGVAPFDTGELVNPQTVVFINVERHSRASAIRVQDEWKAINDSLDAPVKILSKGKISKLTTAARTINAMKSSIQKHVNNTQDPDTTKVGKARFLKQEPSVTSTARLVARIVDKMTTVNKSENTFKKTKQTFSKPNRRDPLDFNRKGKLTSTQYKPDIHIYLDTSGSISETNYQAAIKMCIQIAKKLNVNLYFNSFSHVMSGATKVDVKNKSATQAYKEFLKIPKVSGGTDYEQIWHYINQSQKRKKELSLIISDFEWTANKSIEHPKNLYYAPCANMDWDYMVRCATRFSDSMTHIDPKIRQKILM